MEFLLNNPLATMDGPQFLVLYIAQILSTLIAVYWFVHRHDRFEAPVPSLTSQPDPYEVALLRGGENEVIRLAILALLQREYLNIESDGSTQTLKATILPDTAESLNPIEHETLSYFQQPHTASQIFASQLPARVRLLLASSVERLIDAGLLTPPTLQRRANIAGMVGLLAIMGFGGYKLYAAFETGHHNVALLIILMIVSLFFVGACCHVPRLTGTGRKYLQQLQLAYTNLRARLNTDGLKTDGLKTDGLKTEENKAGDYQDANQNINLGMLAVSVYGTSALATTPYAELNTMFLLSTQVATSGAGCGAVASCGSSGGDSGGGGGCSSGCGGGGCGGCGGG